MSSNPIETNDKVSMDKRKSCQPDIITSYSMPYRHLGHSGLKVSRIVLGTWITFGNQISDETAEQLVTFAYENGINTFDTSESYSNGRAELTLGKILAKKLWKRSSYIVCTKIHWVSKTPNENGLSRKHIIEGIHNSLKRLQLSYIDIVLANKYDPKIPMEEIVRAFTFLINQGMAFYWGTTRWSPAEIMEAHSIARYLNLIPPITEQTEYHMLNRERVEQAFPELTSKIGLGLMTHSPLAGGFLTGKYEYGIPAHSRASLPLAKWFRSKISSDDGITSQKNIRLLSLIAIRLGCTMPQLALAWCLKNHSTTCVVVGATTLEQLTENIQAVKFVSCLTRDLMNEIEGILQNKPDRTKIRIGHRPFSVKPPMNIEQSSIEK